MSFQSELHDSIQSLMREHSDDDEPWNKGVLTQWVLVAETVGTDGNEYLHQIFRPGMQAWTRQGLLHGALTSITAARVAGEFPSECED